MILEKEETLAQRFVDKGLTIAVIGLGYVGLPIALEFAKRGTVVGFDINRERVKKMKLGQDPSQELHPDAFKNVDITFTNSLCDIDLHEADVYIVAVPTPIDEYNKPDIGPLLKATETVGKLLRPGNIVVFESTVYPGCTENDCVPVLERVSGMTYKKGFKVAYSPERVNPGDEQHTTSKITKLVAGCDPETTEAIAGLYQLVIEAGVHATSSILLAELSKVVENTQRDINIAFMNEVAMIADKLGLNTFEVLEAARTKWNFLPFTPGLVGGHCISVDPYYLIHKAEQLGVPAKMVAMGRAINETMAPYVASKLIKAMIRYDRSIAYSRVLVMGIAFKPDVADVRNSKIVDIVRELESYGVTVDVIDPIADAPELMREYGLQLKKAYELTGLYDAVIIATGHMIFQNIKEEYFHSITCYPHKKPIVLDITGNYRNKLQDVEYLSL